MYTACPYSTYQSFLENNYDKKPTECSKAKHSARNQLKGRVIDVQEGAVNAKVVIDIGCGHLVTSIITMASLKDLKLL